MSHTAAGHKTEGTTEKTAAKRPNVIWIFGDQHRGQALSCMGDPNVNTPEIDLLAAGGFTSTAAVAGSPLCCPYRGSLLTGRYPHQCVPGHECQMPPEQPTIAQVLAGEGYRTAYIGKWHVDGYHEREGRAAMHIVPPGRRGGFEHWVGYENNNSPWDSWVHGGSGPDAFQRRLPGYETDSLTDLLLDYLRARGKEAGQEGAKPFFAVLSVQPPHDPFVAPAEYMARHNPASIQLRPNVPNIPRVLERAQRDLAGAYAMIENLDWNVGRVRRVLAEAGLAENTHILFFSDHGDMHGSQGMFRKTCPWEESIRVPFIMGGYPGYYTHRTGRAALPVNHVDIAPTTLGLCGVAKPAWMAGTDYSGHRLKGRPAVSEPDSAFLQLVVPTRHGDSVDRAWRGVVTREGWKYVCIEGQPLCMYNLNEDPYEQANLAFNTAFAAERKRLQARLAQWIADTGDAFRLPEI